MGQEAQHLIRPEQIDAELVRQHLERIELSETFGNVEEQRALLRFLVDHRLAGRGRQFTQSEIVEARIVSRSSTRQKQVLLFPNTQAVRTHIGRLRKSLLMYYKYEAPAEPLQIDIPKRQYIATFSRAIQPLRPQAGQPVQETLALPVSESEPKSAEILTKSAVRLYRNGQYSEAEPILQRALSIRQRVLGPEHPDTATSINNLAMLYEKQGRYTEAVPLLERGLEICERTLGPEHPETIVGVNNLAIGYMSQARYKDAAILLERALSSREQVLGSNHPDTAMSLNNLAMLYEKQGRYKEAISLLERALEMREKALGPEHRDTAISLNNLAMLYQKHARFNEALPLYERALAICEKVLGPEHPETISVRHNRIDLIEVYYPAAPT